MLKNDNENDSINEINTLQEMLIPIIRIQNTENNP